MNFNNLVKIKFYSNDLREKTNYFYIICNRVLKYLIQNYNGNINPEKIISYQL